MLYDFFIEQIKRIYWGEDHVHNIIPIMQKAVSSQALGHALVIYLKHTLQHRERLEKILELMEINNHSLQCDALLALLKKLN